MPRVIGKLLTEGPQDCQTRAYSLQTTAVAAVALRPLHIHDHMAKFSRHSPFGSFVELAIDHQPTANACIEIEIYQIIIATTQTMPVFT